MMDLERALEQGVSEIKGEFGPREGKLFPTDLGQVRGDGMCTRAFWYKLRDEPTRTVDYDRQLKMLYGDYLEELVIDTLTRSLPTQGYRVVGTQVYVPVPGTTGGKVDILVEHIESGERAVIEVKSTEGKAKRYLPKKGHYLQTQSYMMGLDIDHGFIVYVFRDVDQENTPIPFRVSRDDEEVRSASNDLVAMAEGPEPPPTDKPWQKKYCDLKNCKCA